MTSRYATTTVQTIDFSKLLTVSSEETDEVARQAHQQGKALTAFMMNLI